MSDIGDSLAFEGVTALPSHHPSEISSPLRHVFLSYCRQNIDFARYLRALIENEGMNVWMDEKRLGAGDNWWKTIEHSIDTCAAFVIIMSPGSDSSRYVHAEMLRAFDQDKVIFPILLEGSVFSLLASLQYEDMRAGLIAKLSPSFVERVQTTCNITPPRHKKRRRESSVRRQSIMLQIVQDDVQEFDCDVLLLKYAEYFYGADRTIAENLRNAVSYHYWEDKHNDPVKEVYLEEKVGNHVIVQVPGECCIRAKKVLFLSTDDLLDFTYGSARKLSKRWLEIVSNEILDVKHIAMTVHGIDCEQLGIGESVEAQISGLLDSARCGAIPPNLERITIVERVPERVTQIEECSNKIFEEVGYAAKINEPNGGWSLTFSSMLGDFDGLSLSSTDDVNVNKGGKNYIRVKRAYAVTIMSYNSSMEDYFYYGIQRPVHAMGLLCEQIMFTSSVSSSVIEESMKTCRKGSNNSSDDRNIMASCESAHATDFEPQLHSISGATVVIVDMTNITNDNKGLFHFFFGYALGKDIPTVMLINQSTLTPSSLPVDSKLLLYQAGKKSIVSYEKIWQLEANLGQWLKEKLE